MEVKDLEIVGDSPSDHTEKLFGYCKVNWKIKNFCLATCNDDSIINSAEFYIGGPQLTKWRMFLIPSSVVNERCIVLYLERLEPDGPKTVWVNWETSLLDKKGNEICKTECKNYFDKKAAYKVNLQNIGFVLDKILPFEPDVLIVRCKLIVNDEDSIRQWENAKSIGLRSLSQDLGILFKYSKFHDVVFRIHGKEIRAHKSIIRSRNSKLSGLIEERGGEKIIPLAVDFEAMEKILLYLYSGNLESVFSKPTISLHECAQIWNIEEINKYYIEEKVRMHTYIEGEYLRFIWIIKDFNSRYGERILSPILNKGVSDVSWRLILYPTGVRDPKYISLFAEIYEGMLGLLDVCLEFAIVSSNRKYFGLKRIRKSFNVSTILGFYEFANRDALEFESLLTDNTLSIATIIRLTNREQVVGVNKRIDYISTCRKSKSTYDSLSSDLSGMFKTGAFRDITLLADAKQFKVHKCILEARSKVLASMLNRLREGEATMNIPNIQPNILRIALNYMYSGFMKDFDLEDIFKVYDLAISFELFSLKDTCIQTLQDSINVKNANGILVFADDKKELELKDSCLKFICCYISTGFNANNLKSSFKVTPALEKDVKDYLKNNFQKLQSST